MFKNKYVFWSGIGVWLLLVVGAGGWFWQHQHPSTKTAAHVAEQSAGTNTQTAPETAINQTTNGQAVISGQPTGTQTITGSAGGSSSQGGVVAGASTSNDASKLIDPSTYAQYDKYKNDKTASYIDLQIGTGATLASGQKAAVYYRGWLTNGTLFDESKAGSDGKLQAFVFTDGQGQVIRGWEEAVTGMKVGGVRLLIVPPAAGYGATAQGTIPANSVLIFQVQLAAVQ